MICCDEFQHDFEIVIASLKQEWDKVRWIDSQVEQLIEQLFYLGGILGSDLQI